MTRLLLTLAAGSAFAGALYCGRGVERSWRHAHFCDRVRGELKTLAQKRPDALSRKQWENVVAWTLNAHGNCLTFQTDIPRAERARFEAELHRRLQGPVDLHTIDWIWDEIVRLTYWGRHYSDAYRPTSPERLRGFEEGNATWGIRVE